ncbi:phage tail tube protein [Rhizobium ruizarguesonis]
MSGVRFFRKLAILVKPEITQGEDAAPAAANAVILSNVTFTPITGDRISRDLLLPYLGNQGVILAGIYGRIEGDLEIAGSGVAGTAPKFSSLMRAASFAETVTAGTKVEYTIVEDGTETVSVYFVSDKVQHVFVGAKANFAPSFVTKNYPKARINIVGMLGTITDVGAMPVVSRAGWGTPVPVSKANTIFSLHGWNAVAESLSLDLGNTLTPRFLMGDERVVVSNRSATGTAVVEAKALSEVNWFDKTQSKVGGALSIKHGTQAGNIVTITAPRVEIGEPTQGQTDGILNYSLPLDLVPVNGLDELKITFT